MRIGIYHACEPGDQLFTPKRIRREARALGISTTFIDGNEINIMVGKNRQFQIYHKNEKFVLPPVFYSRLESTSRGINLLIQSHIERSRRTRVVNKATAISYARDKYRVMQVLAAKGFNIPRTVLLGSSKDIEWAIKQVGGLPAILKLSRGKEGIGVMKVDSLAAARSVHDIVSATSKVVVQEYIAINPGVDYRFYIVGDKVVAAMRRSSKAKDEFRSNFSLGGKVEKYNPPPAVARQAVSICKALGLEIAGVDMIESKRGFVPIEANVNPGAEGIEKATGINVSLAMVKYLQKVGKEFLAKNPEIAKQEREIERKKRR